MSFKDKGKLVFSVVLIYIIMQFLGITCPIKFLTGVSCAGCGMTRAFISLLKLDFSSAFYFHPLFFMPFVVLIIFLFRKYLPKWFLKLSFIIILSSFIIVYFIRMFQPDNSIVSFEIKNGLIYKLLSLLMKI